MKCWIGSWDQDPSKELLSELGKENTGLREIQEELQFKNVAMFLACVLGLVFWGTWYHRLLRGTQEKQVW